MFRELPRDQPIAECPDLVAIKIAHRITELIRRSVGTRNKTVRGQAVQHFVAICVHGDTFSLTFAAPFSCASAKMRSTTPASALITRQGEAMADDSYLDGDDDGLLTQAGDGVSSAPDIGAPMVADSAPAAAGGSGAASSGAAASSSPRKPRRAAAKKARPAPSARRGVKKAAKGAAKGRKGAAKGARKSAAKGRAKATRGASRRSSGRKAVKKRGGSKKR